MQTERIRQRIETILRDELHVAGPLHDTTALLGDNVLDSMDFANYLTRVEEEFGLSISNEDVAERRLGIVGKMVEYLAERTGGGAGGGHGDGT